jgi:hypothetical protein
VKTRLGGGSCGRKERYHPPLDRLADADWMLRDEIEGCLVSYFQSRREVIPRCVQEIGLMDADVATN